MEVGKLSVEYRSSLGKANVRRLRTTGKIPAIVYGGANEPLPLSVDPTLLMKALDPQKKTNTVIKLQVTGAPGGDQELLVMVRDHQRDALKGHLTHADFIRVQLDKDVHAVIPIVLTGKPEGVKLGGILHQVIHRLEIACTPDKIPVKLEIDVSHLNMGEAIHVSDLKLGEGLKPLAAGGTSVCSVTAPKAEKVAEPTPEQVAAEAAAAAGAPAEGAKPGEAAAAGKPGEAAKAGAAAPAAAKGEKKGGKKE
jgi:large subunit ribosomal protein L25